MCRFLLFWILLFCLSCQTHKIKAKSELIIPYSSKNNSLEVYKAPYITTYIKKAKTLKFIAAAHSNQIEGATFKTILDVFNSFRPHILILEGFENKNEISPIWYIEHSKDCKKENYQNCGEAEYAAFLASENKVPFVAGEPTDLTILKHIQKRSYTVDDLVGFYIIRLIPQWRRKNILQNEDLENRIVRVANKILRENLSIDDSYSWVRFNSWYKKKLEDQFDPSKITEDSISPRIDKNPTFLNILSHEIGMARERHIVKIIETTINQYDRVLVIYGAGHLVKQRAVLADMFGTHKDEKLY